MSEVAERIGPNKMEREIVAKLATLVPLRDAEADTSKRKALSQRIKMLRDLRDFCRTRVGYVEGEDQ